MNHEDRFMVFFVTWCVLGLTSAAFYFLNKNAALKRKWHPWIMSLIGVLFVGFVVWLDGASFPLLVFMIPAVLFITVLNSKNIRFCDACGSTLHAQPFQKMDYCPKCGESLDGQVTKRLSLSSSRSRDMAKTYISKGEYRDAERFLKSALETEEQLNQNGPGVKIVLKDYAKLLRKIDRNSEAQQLELRAKSIKD